MSITADRLWRSSRLPLLGLFVSACAGADGSAAWVGSMDTLPNGAIRVVNLAPAAPDSAGAWTLTREFSIGEAEGTEAETFGSISAFTVDDDGRLYVLDRQMNQLRIFTRVLPAPEESAAAQSL